MAPWTRRQAFTLAAAAAVLSACAAETPAKPAESPPAARPAARPGRLFAETATGLAVVDLATGKVRATYPGAVAEPRWATLYQLHGGHLRTYQAAEGIVIDDVRAAGEQIKAVSAGLAALGPPAGPRTRTRITLVSAGGESRALDLDGNVEPEAFSPDGQAMYVLDRLPPAAPDRYRVRMYDLTQGTMGALQTRDKRQISPGQEEEMRGQGRQAVLDPAQNILYTLYTHQDAHLHTRDLAAGHDLSPGVHAFVHVLHLDQRWAYCLDLPAPFGLGPPPAHTLALQDRRLYVFDASTGRAVVASTEKPAIERSALLGKLTTGEAYATAGAGRLYLAAGTRLVAADGETLAPRAAWDLPGPARGLALLGGELLAGAGDQVLRLDAGTGARLGAIALPGLRTLRHAEPATG
ncbi:hypothetical protein ACFLIM_42110 [Nonomuraea sp. M3C6]|uniref:DNA-binding beta-propeller fold protein YncE n=1 Tax=Nonomuraea marmarensis TaxID=3351344 RepID=A0ABW7AUA0_9ACTN